MKKHACRMCNCNSENHTMPKKAAAKKPAADKKSSSGKPMPPWLKGDKSDMKKGKKC